MDAEGRSAVADRWDSGRRSMVRDQTSPVISVIVFIVVTLNPTGKNSKVSAHICNVRPSPTRSWSTSPTTSTKYKVNSQGGLRHRPLLPDGHAGLRPRGARLPGLHQAARARSCRARSCRTARRCPAPQFQLDPVQAAFNIGAMIRWLDFNDTWLAAEWGHPSDNLGGILADGRLALAQRRRRGQDAAHDARRAHRHDQGARDPGRASRSRTASTTSASTTSCW